MRKRERKIIVRKEVRKYDAIDAVLHLCALILGGILMVTGVWTLAGGGKFASASHVVSGYFFTAAILAHIILLIVRGATRDIPVREFPFLFSAGEFVRWARGEIGVDGKFSLPERVDYFSLFALSLIVVLSGLFVRFPRLLPGGGGIEVVYGFLKIHGYSALGLTFWVLGVHVYITTVKPLPGGNPASIFAKPLSPEFIESARPRWFEELVREGSLEVLEEGEEQEVLDRERVVALLEEGNRKYREGKFEEAERYYREALSLYPAYSQAHYNLAVLLRKMGRREECLEQCRKFLQVDPFHPLTERVREMMREVGEGEGEGG